MGADPDRYLPSLTDWLACAAAGRGERAARAAAAAGSRATFLGTAGHVLDFDDTWTPGLAHLSAATAPAAFAAAEEAGASLDAAIRGYARGFEAMAALSGHAHPQLYERGVHPTAATGTAGAAVAAASVLGLDSDLTSSALAVALTRTGGLQAAFGSDGKALQVGSSVAAGIESARLAAAGVRLEAGPMLEGLCASWGIDPLAPADLLEPRGAAVERNWIKAYPCCLQTHTAIECALSVDAAELGAGELRVRVHPLSLRAAPIERPASGLEARFSIPYLVAWALLRGRPGIRDLGTVEPEALAASERLAVAPDEELGQSEAVLELDGHELARVEEALGSPSRPMSVAELEAKAAELAGPGLAGLLDDRSAPAGAVLRAAGLAA